MTPKATLLEILTSQDFVTLPEARELGVNKMMLSRLVANGALYRPFRQIYTSSTDLLTDPIRRLAPVCTLYLDAVVCGVSALIFYDLTDEIENQVWVAFPQDHRVRNKEYRIIYPQGLSYLVGIVKHKALNRVIRIYDEEKTVVDAFKFLPTEVAHKALRRYLKKKDRNLRKLLDYGRKLKKPLDKIVTILISGE